MFQLNDSDRVHVQRLVWYTVYCFTNYAVTKAKWYVCSWASYETGSDIVWPLDVRCIYVIMYLLCSFDTENAI